MNTKWIKQLAPAALVIALGSTGSAAAAAGQDLDCVIEASEISDVSSAVRGVIEDIAVKQGDWVEKGQVLAQIEASVEQATLDLAKERLSNTQQIQARQTRLALAEKRWKRIRDLRKNKAIASQDLDEAETEYVLAKIELDQAMEERRIAELEYNRAKKILDLRTVKSPVTGVVVKIHTSAGELLENDPIMRVAQIDPLHVEAIAPVDLLGTIKKGDVFQVVPEKPVGGGFDAKVSMVEQIVDASSGTFGVRLVLPNDHGALPAGLRCKLKRPWLQDGLTNSGQEGREQ